MISKAKKQWYAVYTRARSEKRVAAELAEAGVEVYLPLLKTLRQWSDRKKKVEEPLIRSYIFVRIKGKTYYDVLNTQGVVKFVKFNEKPAPIPDWQIKNLKILLNSGESFDEEHNKFYPGDLVKINKGSLKGLKGIITEVKGKSKLVIKLDVININFTVNIHSVFVEPVSLSEIL